MGDTKSPKARGIQDESDAALSFVSLFFSSAAIGRSLLLRPPRTFFLLTPFPFSFRVGIILYAMALWRGFSQQLCRAAPKAAAGEICLAQSRRYVSSTAPWSSRGIANPSRWNARAHNNLRTQSQRLKSAQRSFSVTAQAAHGHITPPKPGEE